jgi:CRISPR/Cas system-associated exonuclease Cas4 (RecB family)
MINNWSFSRLTEFESCAYRAKLKIIDRVPEPERPLPPGKTEHANDRGTRIHSELEAYIRDKGKFPVEALKFKAEIEALRRRFADGEAELEGEWGFNKDWEPCDYRKAWLKVKCDAVVHISPTHIAVIDFKTGRKQGNEMKHSEQLQLYALAAAIKYGKAETITVELWYLDVDDETVETKPVSKWLYALKLFNNRGLKMTSATEFKPNPNVFSCQYCAYKEGICEYAVTNKKAQANIFARKAIVRRKGS